MTSNSITNLSSPSGQDETTGDTTGDTTSDTTGDSTGDTSGDEENKCTVIAVEHASLGNTHNLGDLLDVGATYDVTCNSG